jgi:type IV pilus assembly protein PilM
MAHIGVGIDIGHEAIKLVQITKKKDKLELTDYAKIPIPPGSIDAEGLIINESIVIDALQQACYQAHVKHKKIITALAGNIVTIKHLNLPVMLGPKLAEVIRFEVEKFLTFPVNKAEYDWEIIRQHDNGEMELMIVAAPSQIIHRQLNCLKQAGLKAAAIDVQPFAQLRSLSIVGTPITFGAHDDLSGLAILDIGATMTQMCIYYQGSIREIRIISTAGNKITLSIAEQLQISNEKAEALKCNLGDADFQLMDSDQDSESYRANQIISEKLTELVMEIQRSFDYFKLQFPEACVTECILTGGGCKLRNLTSHLESKLGVKVGRADPLSPLQINSKIADRSTLLGNPYQFSGAIGLALRGVECR